MYKTHFTRLDNNGWLYFNVRRFSEGGSLKTFYHFERYNFFDVKHSVVQKRFCTEFWVQEDFSDLHGSSSYHTMCF
jgi:hypothetical protein